MPRASDSTRTVAPDRARPASKVAVVRIDAGDDASSPRRTFDRVAGEEPLEIRLVAAGEPRTVAVTMRTPGHDFELAVGFLFGEGVIRERDDIARVAYCTEVDEEQRFNVVNVVLRPGREAAVARLERLERHFVTTSACGICGRAQLDDLVERGLVALDPTAGPRVPAALVASLPNRLREGQSLFARTGGVHAAGIFARDGAPRWVREDVGRHNALDKAVGAALLDDALPLGDALACLSGRASYELVQKAVSAGIPVVAAVSAPSSLAVATAERFGITLAAFVRDDRLNVYAGAERIGEAAGAEPA